MESKIWYKWSNLSTKEKQTENRPQRVEMGERWLGSLGLEVTNCYSEWIHNVLPYSTRNYIQYPVINHSYMEDSHFQITLLISYPQISPAVLQLCPNKSAFLQITIASQSPQPTNSFQHSFPDLYSLLFYLFTRVPWLRNVAWFRVLYCCYYMLCHWA